jgi:hypothetical protein
MILRFFRRPYQPVIHPKEITALFDPVNNVVMDWSPKVGCTILTKMFFRQMGLLEKALEYHSWIHEYRMHVFSKEFPTQLSDILHPENYTFKVVRNPYIRAVSAYIHTMKKSVMHPPVAGVLNRKDANISFEQFVEFLSKSDLTSCDPHYALQKKYFEFDHPGCFRKIVHLENLEAGIREVNEEGRQHFDLTGLSSHHHAEIADGFTKDAHRIRWSDLADQIPPHLSFFNTELANKVYHLYKADFEDYGYSSKLPES